MNRTHIQKIAAEQGLDAARVQSVADLLADGATVPFVARYRKEVTGSLDEVEITSIRDRLNSLAELDGRREAILKSLETNGHLTEPLKEKVMAADTLAVLEDVYLPYRPKRRTRATMAREKGLEPLARALFEQTGIDPAAAAEEFVDAEKGAETVESALAGARDIIAEWVNEDETARGKLRRLFAEQGIIRSVRAAASEADGAKYKDYFDWEEPVREAPSHRILAMRRGEKEDVLNLTMTPDEATALEMLKGLFLKGTGPDAEQVAAAIEDGYRRLLSRSMETEIRLMTKTRADAEAIRVFAGNLRQLLLAPPLGARRVMGVDPGFRTGCKVVCLDRQGKLLHHDVFYLHAPEKASRLLSHLVETYRVEAVAIGNGTAGRETETFLKTLTFPHPVQVAMVNESGASIYSASGAAREEFPDLDLTVRGAISIGRRLMDPLSELVKIDPKSIGVGQYQHDVDATALKQSLDDVVVSCVNSVGVDVNRASAQLLSYVSGLGPALAKNIVTHRDEHGPFTGRKELKKVKRLGPKAFEQSAGFLRIQEGKNPLDASAVHPESYPVVEHMARSLDCTVSDLMKEEALRKQIQLPDFVTDAVGLPTLQDILAELAKPGRDPREQFEAFAFDSGVQKMADLEPGMRLPGIVTNVTAFGAFVDIGVHQDGLVHISQLADRFIKDPAQVVKVHQKVSVAVLAVDIDRKRISLSMKSSPDEGDAPSTGKDQRPVRTGMPKKPPKKSDRTERPFNTPFADAFGKQAARKEGNRS